MSIGTYILDDRGEPVRCDDIQEWARWTEQRFRNDDAFRVGRDEIGPWTVSTVFLGVDYNPGGKPVLWETMTFGPEPFDKQVARCSGGREQAEAMHADMIARVEAVAALNA